MSPPTKEGGPAASRAAITRTAQLNGNRRQNGYTAPAAQDRAELAALELLTDAGYRLACRCLDCKRWLADPISVAAMRGPTCRARAGVVG